MLKPFKTKKQFYKLINQNYLHHVSNKSHFSVPSPALTVSLYDHDEKEKSDRP